MSKVYCRRCRYCEVSALNKRPAANHLCVQNWPSNQSSKAMEPAAILDMAINSVPKRNFVIGTIISDDDSTMHVHLRHPSDDPGDKGKLPVHVKEPIFLADPGHRLKAISKHFFALAKQPVSKSCVNTHIAKRLKKIGDIWYLQTKKKQ